MTERQAARPAARQLLRRRGLLRSAWEGAVPDLLPPSASGRRAAELQALAGQAFFAGAALVTRVLAAKPRRERDALLAILLAEVEERLQAPARQANADAGGGN